MISFYVLSLKNDGHTIDSQLRENIVRECHNEHMQACMPKRNQKRARESAQGRNMIGVLVGA